MVQKLQASFALDKLAISNRSLDYIPKNTTSRALLLRFVTENAFVAQIG
jgi:hypothetical protein